MSLIGSTDMNLWRGPIIKGTHSSSELLFTVVIAWWDLIVIFRKILSVIFFTGTNFARYVTLLFRTFLLSL